MFGSNRIKTIKVNNTDFTVHRYDFEGKPYVMVSANVSKKGIRQSGKLDRAKTDLTKVADMLGVYKELDEELRKKGILLQSTGISLADPTSRDIRHTPIRDEEDPQRLFSETCNALGQLAKKYKGEWVLTTTDEVNEMMKDQSKHVGGGYYFAAGVPGGDPMQRSKNIKLHLRLEVEYALDDININPDTPEVQAMIGEVEKYIDQFHELNEPWTRIVSRKPTQFIDDMGDIVARTMPSTPKQTQYEITSIIRAACDGILAPDGLDGGYGDTGRRRR